MLFRNTYNANEHKGMTKDEMEEFKEEWKKITDILKPIYKDPDNYVKKYNEYIQRETVRCASGKTFR